MTHRTLLLSTAAILLGASLLTAQVPTEEAREFYRETIREKIRFDVERYGELPTVGQIRASVQQADDDAGKPGASILAAEDVLVSGDQSPESEVHAAINPTDSSNIIVSPIRQSTGTLTCPIYYTRDFGKTWRKSRFVNLPPENNAVVFGGGDPVFAFDADGRAYFTWINLYGTSDNDSTIAGIFWASSDDGGETWEFDHDNIVVIDAVRAGAPLGVYQLPRFCDKQWMAADLTDGPHRNTLYVAYAELSITGQRPGQIAVRRLLPESGGFVNNSVPVSTAAFTLVQFSSIGVDEAGNVHVSFFGQRGNSWGLWHSFSTDAGQSFSEPVNVSPVRFGGRFGGAGAPTIQGIETSRLYPSPYIAVDRSGTETEGSLYLVWTALGTTSDAGKGYDIYLSRLEGFNDPEAAPEWSAPVIVNDDDEAGDQFYPSVTVSPEGVVIVSWYDKRGDANGRHTHYYMAYSFDGGRTFLKNIQVSSAATDFGTIGNRNGGFGIGEYTQVLATSGYAIPVWADGRAGNGNMDIYAAFMPITSDISNAPLYPEHVTSVEEGITVGEVVPNPVAGEDAHLTFRLERSARVDVDLIDVRGTVVRSIAVDRPFDAGEHRVTIPTDGLSAGVYFSRVSTGRAVAARKVTVE